MTRPSDFAWAAGIFEGEGCLSRTNTDSCRIDVAMHQRDLDVLRRLRRVMGRGKLYGPYNNKMVFWIVYGREEVCSVLLDWWPWLGRRRKAKALKFFPRLREYRVAA